MNIIAAIDPSLTNTAVCTGDADHYDMASFSSKPRGAQLDFRMARYLDLVDRVSSHLADIHGVSTIFIEGYSHGSKFNGEVLAEYGALLRCALMKIAPTREVAPKSLKKFATGKGNADKISVATSLSRRYDVEFKTSDEYDAFGLFQLGLVACGMANPETAKQREAAEAVY